MKKITFILALVALVAFGGPCFAADLQDGRVSFDNVTTNDTTLTSGTIDVRGEILQLFIDCSDSDPVDIDIVDTATGITVYSADAVAADVTLVPMLPQTTAAGAAITWANDTATNAVYAPAYCSGLTVTVGDADAGTQDLVIKVLVDKNP